MIFKRINLLTSTLLLLFLTCMSSLVRAQDDTNVDKLNKVYTQKLQAWQDAQNRLKAYASLNKVLITQQLLDGSLMEMVDVEDGRPIYFLTDNSNAAKTARTNRVHPGGSTGLNLSGSGYNKLGLWDAGGVRATHQEFTNNGPSRVTQVDAPSSLHYHATHVAGTMIAGGVLATSKGMAFEANLLAYDWGSDESEMAAAAVAGLEISNHSYGFAHGWTNGTWYGNTSISTQEDYRFGFYSSYTRDWDLIAYNAPFYLIVKSAGNDRNDFGTGYPPDGGTTGYDCIGQRGICKNILTVGAVNDVTNYTGPRSVSMSSFSSWGPADDGRIKPDICANGVSLQSTYSNADNSYAYLSGTSMSSPSASGSLALLQQYYQNQHSGTPLRASTLKALVINTADESGASVGPDYSFGWGLLNTEVAANVITTEGTSSLIIEDQLANGASNLIQLNVDGTSDLFVTVVWTDPAHAALPAALDPTTPHLVNDLDAKITNGGNTYYPYKLNGSIPAAAATNNGENNADNVEHVFIANPGAGVYTLTIDHDGTLAANQHYSVVVRGAILHTQNAQPTAAFTSSITCTSVSFTDGSTDSDGTVTAWSWDFGDGNSSSLQNPSHIYASSGSYLVSLTATDNGGATDATSSTVITTPLSTYYLDSDNDGYGDLNSSTQSCTQPNGYVTNNTDCNDGNNAINPGASEVCGNGIDDNCNGQIDEGCNIAPMAAFTSSITCTSVSFTDGSTDSDGTVTAWSWDFGDGNSSSLQNPSHIYASSGSYLVSLTATDNGGATDATSSTVITTPLSTYYLDSDNDGYGDLNSSTQSCTQPNGYVTNNTDCNDGNNAINPGASEVCGNGIDDNCNGQIDEGCNIAPTAAFQPTGLCTSYDFTDLSSDPDGSIVSWSWTFGDGNSSVLQNPSHIYASAGSYTVALLVTDNLGATANTSQTIVVSPLTIFYADGDSDSYGDPNVSQISCNQPNGYVTNSLDCNDSDFNINPGATEICGNGIDDNCNGQVDEGCNPCVVVDDESFENGWGIWNDGGGDCRKRNRFANTGSYSIRLRDNSNSSVMTTDNLNLSAYATVEVDFSCLPRKLDSSSEDLWLQISTNGGSSYATVEEWNLYDEIFNGVRFNDNVLIPGPFTSTTKIRFRADATDNKDHFWIDDIKLTACTSAINDNSGQMSRIVITQDPKSNPSSPASLEETKTKTFQLFPVPSSGKINLDFGRDFEGLKEITIYDLNGKLIYQLAKPASDLITIDLDHLSTGIYLLKAEWADQNKTKRFIITK